MSRRVVITGIGLLSSVGVGTDETWKAILAGKNGISRITAFDASEFACQIAGEVRDFQPEKFVERKEIEKMGRFIQFAIAASEFATSMAGLKVDRRRQRASGRIHRQRNRRIRSDRAGAPQSAGEGAGPHFAFLHPGHDRQSRFGPRIHSPQRQRAQLGHVHGLHDQRPRHWRFLPHHPARRCRRDDLRRSRGLHLPDGHRRLRGHAGAVHAERRAGESQPPVGQAARRLRGGRGLRHPGAGGAGAGPSRGEPRSSPRLWATA